MGAKRLDRLGDLARHDLLVRFTCLNPNCRRVALYEPTALIACYGHDIVISMLNLPCVRCGGTRIVARGAPRITPPPAPIRPEPVHEETPPPARSRRPSPQPAASLGAIRRLTSWVWLYCDNVDHRGICGHYCAIPLAPFIIRWGKDASSDLLRKSFVCSKCGARTTSIKHPSWADRQIGFQMFPSEAAMASLADSEF